VLTERNNVGKTSEMTALATLLRSSESGARPRSTR
jgi:hypothetical protein